jgi:hypothetical protein
LVMFFVFFLFFSSCSVITISGKNSCIQSPFKDYDTLFNVVCMQFRRRLVWLDVLPFILAVTPSTQSSSRTLDLLLHQKNNDSLGSFTRMFLKIVTSRVYDTSVNSICHQTIS